MAPSFESRDVTRVERGVVGIVVVGVLLVVLSANQIALLLQRDRLALVVFQFLLIVWGFLAALLRNLWVGSPERTTVRANRQGLWVGGEFIPSTAIRRAHAFVRREVVIVRVERRGLGFPLDIGVRDAADGERLVRALDLDGKRRDELEIGADGLVIPDSGARRFIPYARLARAATDAHHPDRIELLLEDGERLVVPSLSGGAWLTSRQIEQAKAACGEDLSTEEAPLLRRGDRAPRAWIEKLRAVGLGAHAAHRTAPVPPDRLWRIVECPGSSPTLRAAAAVALGPRLDARDRERLRAAASTTSAPRLRLALEGAASTADQAELSALLAGVEEEEGPPAADRRRSA
jgi:hypothetical protein